MFRDPHTVYGKCEPTDQVNREFEWNMESSYHEARDEPEAVPSGSDVQRTENDNNATSCYRALVLFVSQVTVTRLKGIRGPILLVTPHYIQGGN